MKLHRTDFEERDGKMISVIKNEIYGWLPVNTLTGQVEMGDFQQFDDQLSGDLNPNWEWRRFTLTLSEP